LTRKHPTHADEPGLPASSEDTRPDAVTPLESEPAGAADPRDAVEALDLSATDAGEERLAALAAELERAKDARLRAEADLQNARRRHLRELDESERAGAERMLAPVLSLVDDLDRALESADGAGVVDSALAQGVALARQRLLDTLAALGLVAIAPAGEPFDPHAHEALLHAPHASVPAGHVSQVVARGFRQGDRVLRAARVIVSSGTPGKD
jgi:molecular chaperone GrpE